MQKRNNDIGLGRCGSASTNVDYGDCLRELNTGTFKRRDLSERQGKAFYVGSSVGACPWDYEGLIELNALGGGLLWCQYTCDARPT